MIVFNTVVLKFVFYKACSYAQFTLCTVLANLYQCLSCPMQYSPQHVGSTSLQYGIESSLTCGNGNGENPKALMWLQALPKPCPPVMPSTLLGENSACYGTPCCTLTSNKHICLIQRAEQGRQAFISTCLWHVLT